MKAAGEIVCNFATAASCYMREIDRSHKIWPDEARRDRHFSTEESESTFIGRFSIFCRESVKSRMGNWNHYLPSFGIISSNSETIKSGLTSKLQHKSLK